MSVLDLTRQSGLIDGHRAESVTVRIIGAGAIGSHVAEVLAKMGIRHIWVQDFDTVESHNLPNQGYYLGDLGQPKVEALANRLAQGTGALVVPENTRLDDVADFQEEIVIAAVDSMEVRRLIFDSFAQSRASAVLLDGRMGARFGKVLFCEKRIPGRLQGYADTLHAGGLYQEPCTQKSTIFCAYGLAGVMGAFVAKYLMEETTHTSADIDFSHMFMDRVVGA
jgi:hypothetical protein